LTIFTSIFYVHIVLANANTMAVTLHSVFFTLRSEKIFYTG